MRELQCDTDILEAEVNHLWHVVCDCPSQDAEDDAEKSSLDTLFDPNLSSCRQEHSWRQIRKIHDRFVTGGLGKLLEEDKYEVWLCDNGDACAPVGDSMCYVYNERIDRFEPLALNSRLHFF